MKKAFLCLFTYAAFFSVHAQDFQSSSNAINNIKGEYSHEIVITDSKININQFENWLIQHVAAHQDFSLKKIDSNKDIMGNTHVRYKQYYKGLLVDGTMINLHCKGELPYSFNGFCNPYLSLETDARISKEMAIKMALQSYPKQTLFAWQVESDSLLKKYGLPKNATFAQYPSAELLIIHNEGNNTKYRLAYKFNICSILPFEYKEIYVDAQNGSILFKKELISHFDKNAVAYTKYSGKQNIVCDSLDSNLYTLIERGRGLDSIVIENAKNSPSFRFYNTDTIWNNFNAQKDEVAGDVMWGIEKTYDYFKEKFARNSFDNKGHSILGSVHNGINNAAWLNGGDGIAIFGDGDNLNYNPWTSIDIVAHEITHGVTRSTANLYFEKESGALSESFSDIFAKCVEKYAIQDSFSWSLCKPIFLNGHLPVRVLDNPNQVNHPKYYFGKHFDLTNSDDFYGIHKNCGVQNYWFYLLSEGGIGTREADAKPYNVRKIGMDTAAIIAYYTLTNYLTEFSGFKDAAAYSIAATRLLFGDSSHLVQEIINAWYAVGVLNTTSISEKKSLTHNEWSIYPNPTKGIVVLSRATKNNQETNFKLFDLTGRVIPVVFSSQNQNEVSVDLATLSAGLYFIELLNEDGEKQILRVVKE